MKTHRRITRAIIVGAGLGAVCAPAGGAGLPVIDGSAIAAIVETTSAVAKQIEQLRRVTGAIHQLQSAIGINVIDIGPVESMLTTGSGWMQTGGYWAGKGGETLETVEELLDEKDGNATDEEVPDTSWYDLLIPSAHATSHSPTTGGSTSSVPRAVARGGEVDGWEDRGEVDRPRFEDYEQAQRFAVETLFVPLGGSFGLSSNEGRVREGFALRYRLRIGLATAVHAWSLGSAAAASWPKRQEERKQLTDMLKGATTLREDVQVLTAATIVGAMTRADTMMLTAAALELEAIHTITGHRIFLDGDDADLLAP